MQHQCSAEDEEELQYPMTRSGHSALSLFVDEEGYSGDELVEEEEDVRFAHPSPDLSSLTISGPLSSRSMGRLLEAGSQLTRVQLSYGNLTSLPVEMCYALPNLTSLSLWNNKITSLPPQVALLTKLSELDLTRNSLSSLPGRILEVPAPIFYYK
jgi:Leucine-rich repeat (LRR) protein